MPRSLLLLALLAAVVLVACAPSEAPDDTSDGTWVGTITTEGNVTTVVNESGSVWGGTARLVEEISIGLEAGPDEYMFGFINSLYVNDDRIVVLDEQADAVRLYDHAGNFLFNVGGAGEGPGEFVYPMILTMDAQGSVLVLDRRTNSVNEYTAAGEYVRVCPHQTFNAALGRCIRSRRDSCGPRMRSSTEKRVRAASEREPTGPRGRWVK